jgi:DegV family protein with EDD domain
MSKVMVVTDSTTFFPEGATAGLPLHVTPVTVIFGEETFKDGVDMHPDQFYRRLSTSKVLPTTSQPTPEDFIRLFSAYLEEGYDVLGILVSHKLSGTVASAESALATLATPRLAVVDGLSVSLGTGFPALLAARAAKEGASLAECKALAEKARGQVEVLFTVDTLEFLHRGGRIGGATRFLGTALNFKPILEIRDGRIEPLERVRTRNKALDRIVELAVERIGTARPARVAVIHADCEPVAQKVLADLAAKIELAEQWIAPLSPAVGVHAGPATVGLAILRGM